MQEEIRKNLKSQLERALRTRRVISSQMMPLAADIQRLQGRYRQLAQEREKCSELIETLKQELNLED